LNKKIRLALLAAALLAGAAALSARDRSDDGSGAYRIAVSNDAASLLISEVSEKYSGRVDVSDGSNVSFLRLSDCCGVQAEMFLSKGDFDMAVLCPDAAEIFVGSDPGFEILGGIIKRSNVILYKGEKHEKTLRNIGYTSGKNTQAEAALSALDDGITLIPMMRTALAYAMERGAADGVVVDILDALKAEGSFKIKLLDYEKPTSVLVARRSIENTEAFKDFLSVLNQCADELNGAGAESALGRHIEGRDPGEMMEIWRNLQTTYIEIPNEK
jgi:hypothetical protein